MSSPKIRLYWNTNSAPCRGTWLVIKQLGLESSIDFQLLDLFNKEQLKPEFLSLNIQHTVPLLIDGDLHLTESRAISTYLAAKYNATDLYPTDIVARTKVDERLYFDATFLHVRMRAITRPILYEGCTEISKEKVDGIQEAFGYMNHFLSRTKYIAADNLTIADLHCLAVVETSIGLGARLEGKLVEWYERCQTKVKGFQEHKEFSNKYVAVLKSKVQ